MKRAPSARAPSPSAEAGRPRASAGPGDGGRVGLDPEVTALMAQAIHPLASDIDAARAMILAVDPRIREAVKWNAPSYRTTDFFATVNLRVKDHVQLVFHTGAKVKATATTGVTIDDPAGLCRWLGKDRCLVTLGAGPDLVRHRPAFEALVRQWLTFL